MNEAEIQFISENHVQLIKLLDEIIDRISDVETKVEGLK